MYLLLVNVLDNNALRMEYSEALFVEESSDESLRPLSHSSQRSEWGQGMERGFIQYSDVCYFIRQGLRADKDTHALQF